MRFIGNLLWFTLGGGAGLGLVWCLAGVVWCITIAGIPVGIACFRIASFSFFPFGKELVPAELVGEKAGAGSALLNFFWCILSGFWLALFHAVCGMAELVTVIGIPFGLANFKIATAAFAPLGKRIVSSEVAAAARARQAQEELERRLAKKEEK